MNYVLLMAGGQNAQGGGAGSGLIMLILIVVIFYFFMIRPQTKRQKEEKKFREMLQKGQEVLTIGGVHGKVREVLDTTVKIEIAHDVVIEIEKTAISMTANSTQNTSKQ